MPPKPGRHLDLFLVPTDERDLPDTPSLLKGLEAVGLVRGNRPGPESERLISGGYRGLRVDVPEGTRLYANGQGGFRVRCPNTGENIVPAFQSALSAWRRGGARSLHCPSCGEEHALDSLDIKPTAVFGRGAIVLVDVASARPSAEGLAWVQDLIGPVVVVGARR